jgi:hypothetical protein
MSNFGFGYDPELPRGFQEADFEQYELEQAGREYSARARASEKARAQGDLQKAAELCPHGGGYPLDSLAAKNSNDPRAGEKGDRCCDCGSVVSEVCNPEAEILVPCDWRPPGR